MPERPPSPEENFTPQPVYFSAEQSHHMITYPDGTLLETTVQGDTYMFVPDPVTPRPDQAQNTGDQP